MLYIFIRTSPFLFVCDTLYSPFHSISISISISLIAFRFVFVGFLKQTLLPLAQVSISAKTSCKHPPRTQIVSFTLLYFTFRPIVSFLFAHPVTIFLYANLDHWLLVYFYKANTSISFIPLSFNHSYTLTRCHSKQDDRFFSHWARLKNIIFSFYSAPSIFNFWHIRLSFKDLLFLINQLQLFKFWL